MRKNFTPSQKAKITAARAFVKNYQGQDMLYNLVVIIGPALFGSFFYSNSDTVWSRVEKPGSFRLTEMISVRDILDITMDHLITILDLQMRHNEFELLNKRLIGRFRYQRDLLIKDRLSAVLLLFCPGITKGVPLQDHCNCRLPLLP